MSSLNKEQKESIFKRISFVLLELKDLEAMGEISYETYNTNRTVRRNVERIVENLVNAIIDISKILLASEEIELPATYREAVLELAKAEFISKDLAESLSNLVRARNVLAHQYLDIRWELIKQFLTGDIGQVKDFLRIVEEKAK